MKKIRNFLKQNIHQLSHKQKTKELNVFLHTEFVIHIHKYYENSGCLAINYEGKKPVKKAKM